MPHSIDYLSILAGLGKECIGAIQVTEGDVAANLQAYRKLSLKEIKELASGRFDRSILSERIVDGLKCPFRQPIEDLLMLWDITAFNWLIGNTDNHIKNLSILYSPDLKSLRLAPAYDILCTRIYRGSTRDMAFNIGGKYRLEEIGPSEWKKAAQETIIPKGYRISAAL